MVIHDHGYHGYSHRELVEMLAPADPETVRTTHAARWRHVSEALDAVSEALNETIIEGHWSGPAAREFHDRLAAASTAAGRASLTAQYLSSGLDCLAGDLGTAKRAMPPAPDGPLASPDGGAPVTGGGTIHPLTGGYVQSAASRAAAHRQARQVMTRLGDSMQTDAEYWWPKPTGTVARGGAGGATGPAPTLRTAAATAAMPDASTLAHHGAAPSNATLDQPAHQHPVGTELAGLGGPVAATGPTAGAIGIAAVPAAGPAGPSGAALGTGPLLTGVPPGTALAEATTGRPTTRLAGAVPEEPEPLARSTAGMIGGASSDRRRAEPDEYRTWRTEDDLVWDDPPGPPPLIE